MDLRARALALGLPPEEVEALLGAWAEPHRHYHTLAHLESCLRHLDAARHLCTDPRAVELAVWFHDAVYEPLADDNEARSAAWAERVAGPTVAAMVLATKDHVARDADAQVLLDVDLAILGRPRAEFLAYERGVRAEYAAVPDEIYAVARREVLQHFLDRRRIFGTDMFFMTYEAAARENLRRAIAG
jgi:predicted metal-dependent HD superfamily phosphohydrolase